MSELSKSLEVRGLTAIGDAIVRAATEAEARGDHELSRYLRPYAEDCFAQARLLGRIFAEPTDRYLNPDFTALASVRLPEPEGVTAHV